jgi:TPR repeat protein
MRHKTIIPLLLFSIFSLIPITYAGQNYLSSGTQAYERGDYAGAIREYGKAGARGQYIAGLFYYNGSGVSRDMKQAALWLKKAAEQGHSGASYLLATMYEGSKGVRKDNREAVKWYRNAAVTGNADAATRLGFMYRDGKGIAKDSKEAVKWFRNAAAHGRVEAQFALGMMLENGHGIKRDTAEAAKLFRITASHSLPRATECREQQSSSNYAVQYTARGY